MHDPAASGVTATHQDGRWTRFQHPVAFWLGAAACTAGVILHLPMYLSARSMGYRMAGMPPDAAMLAGMALIVAGLLLALYGLLPSGAAAVGKQAARVRVRAMDDARIHPQHVLMLVVMAVAITIDVMKPATLSFVAPGMTKEYALKSALNPHGHVPVAWLPLFGIAGTVAGSWLWGWVGDRIGRRSSIVYAGLLFVTTSICGAMPGFSWNLLMCFLMGIGAGGMLPIAFALMAETVPARHRGWLMVLIGGGVSAAGYVLTSWLAGALMPAYSWRVMWLVGLPTGLVIIALNRWIPESPRYLLAAGQRDEAEKIMRKFGAAVVEADGEPDVAAERQVKDTFRQLAAPPFLGPSVSITILAIGVGLVTYGFQLWIPTNLQHLGLTAVSSAGIVRNAALIGLPLSAVAAWLYGAWGSKKTITVFTALLTLALFALVITGSSVAHRRILLTALLVVPLSGISLVAAIVSVYATEVYPTRIRSRGAGLAAGMTKAGGVLIIAMVVAAATTPSIAATALIGAVPLIIGIAVFVRAGHETRGRRLEEITQAELGLEQGHALERA